MKKTVMDIINRVATPLAWSEGDNIPWDEPGFSERMLAEHLSQEHDLASRRSASIDAHVEWVFSRVLGSKPSRVLDSACGPGLYSSRLARIGCECLGIDFSPASIRYAQESALSEELRCAYRHADVRDGDYGEGFDLAMMIYGQFNVFPRNIGLEILRDAYLALKPGGKIVLETQTREQLHRSGHRGSTWYSASSGLFSDSPHIVLHENSWDEEAEASSLRFFVIDGKTNRISTYAFSNEAYTESQLKDALEEVGFRDVANYPTLSGVVVDGLEDLPVFVARK